MILFCVPLRYVLSKDFDTHLLYCNKSVEVMKSIANYSIQTRSRFRTEFAGESTARYIRRRFVVQTPSHWRYLRQYL